MFRRETNREFAQGLEIDSLARKVGDVAFDAQLARQEAEAEASRADTSLSAVVIAIQTINNLKATIAEKDRVISLWVEHEKKQDAEIARLKDDLAIASADRDGIIQQAITFKADLPANADSLSDSGERFADGRIKSKARIVYEKTFDATARKLGITNPSSRRKN